MSKFKIRPVDRDVTPEAFANVRTPRGDPERDSVFWDIHKTTYALVPPDRRGRIYAFVEMKKSELDNFSGSMSSRAKTNGYRFSYCTVEDKGDIVTIAAQVLSVHAKQ